MTDLSAFSRQRIRCRIVMWQMVCGCGGNVPKYPKFWGIGASRNATQVLRRHTLLSHHLRANRSRQLSILRKKPGSDAVEFGQKFLDVRDRSWLRDRLTDFFR